MQLNRKKFHQLVPNAGAPIFSEVARDFAESRGSESSSVMVDSLRGRTIYGGKRRPAGAESASNGIDVIYFNNFDTRKLEFSYFVPWFILESPELTHYCYHLGFVFMGPEANERSFDPIRSGYVGMTSRPPLDRFREHRAKALRGGGHALHTAWRSVIELGINVSPRLRILGQGRSRADGLDLEEMLVEDLKTQIPNGLNVIAGGMAGIRELWRLGLMSRSEKPTPEERDAALDRLEHAKGPIKAHYRRGHTRLLPERCAMRTTWVNPCWVGVTPASPV